VNGKAQRTLTVTGMPVEGSGSIVLTGQTYGLTAQVLVNNALNENIFWQNGTEMRLLPGGSEKKLYLLTPETYKLKFIGANPAVGFDTSIKVGDITFIPPGETPKVVFTPMATGQVKSINEYFNNGYVITSNGPSGTYQAVFQVVEGDKLVNITEQRVKVNVGFDNPAIEFFAEAVYKEGLGIVRRTSTYDKTQSSIRLAGNQNADSSSGKWVNGLKITLRAKSGNDYDDNVKIGAVSFVGDNEKNLKLAQEPGAQINQKILYYTDNSSHPNTGPADTIYQVNYVGVLTVEYEYWTSAGKKPQKKNFLVYHDKYYRD
jgi:hypothetical protein